MKLGVACVAVLWPLPADGVAQVGQNPNGVAFDGKNIWVADYGDNAVSKIRRITGRD